MQDDTDTDNDAAPRWSEGARARFEALVLPHLDAAYNLARWLTRNDHDASDVVQDAYLRAMRSFGGFRGDQARPWLLAIVRNAAYTSLARRRDRHDESYEPELHDEAFATDPAGYGSPEGELSRQQDRNVVNEALARLPVELREALVLREMQELSYKEIASIQDIPVGTVMSRLSRGRQMLLRQLQRTVAGVGHG
jgi:RNA polymerase sigma-70 factor, ECF subfamily